MFRYYINSFDFDIAQVISHPTLGHTPLMSMRRIIERPGRRTTRLGDVHWRIEILRWAEEQGIDHCLTVNRHEYIEQHRGKSYRCAMDVVMLGLMNETDTAWLRFRYNILPLPEPFDFAQIVESRLPVRGYRL